MKATRTEKFLSFKILCCYRQNPREAIWKKGTEQNFPVVLFITLYKVALTFESVDEFL